MIMNKPLWGKNIWKDISIHLQEPETILTVFSVPVHKALVPSEYKEADALAQVQSLATDPSLNTTDWVHRKSIHCSAWVVWHTAKDSKCP